jgi:putative ABC transport system permease protein
VLTDLRIAARALRRAPSFTAAVVFILALGIGANATLFSIADAVLLRPFPFVDQDRLVVGGESASEPRSEIPYREYVAWRASARLFDDLAVMGSTNWTLHLRGGPAVEIVRHRSVSANFFPVVGAAPVLGRTFAPSEDRRGAPRTIVLSYGFWQRALGGDERVIGRRLPFSEGVFTVIGVMPPAFRYPAGADAWTAVVTDLAAVPPGPSFEKLEDSNVGVLFVVGRLKAGATLAAARADLNRVIAARHGDGARSIRLESRLTPIVDDILGSTRSALWILIGATSLLLLVACANSAGLLLARSASRRHELAVRRALGASRAALVRQMCCEALLLSALATLAAVAAALVVVPAVRTAMPGDLPRIAEATTGWRTLSFIAAIGVSSAILSWLPPAFQTNRDLEPALRAGQRSIAGASLRQPLRRLLIGGELAAAVVLLGAAGLMLRSVANLSRLDLGFDPAGLFAISLSTPAGASAAVVRPAIDRALRESAAMPGVSFAGAVSNRPLFGAVGNDSPIRVEGQTVEEAAARNPIVNTEIVTPGYFDAMRARRLQGRFFTDDDRDTTMPVIVVSDSLAARLWPGQSAIGRRLQIPGVQPRTTATQAPRETMWTVVGIAADVRNREIAAPAFDLYAPAAQSVDSAATIMVRIDGSEAAALAPIRQRLQALNSDGAVSIESMQDIVALREAPWRANLALFGTFAAITVTIAVVGLYALLSQTVTEQARDIGVRLVLGASPARIAAGVIAAAAPIVAAGAALGTFATAASGRLMQSLLFGLDPLDASTLVAAPIVLTIVALAACVLPAARAAHTDPAACLRQE